MCSRVVCLCSCTFILAYLGLTGFVRSHTEEWVCKQRFLLSLSELLGTLVLCSDLLVSWMFLYYLLYSQFVVKRNGRIFVDV